MQKYQCDLFDDLPLVNIKDLSALITQTPCIHEKMSLYILIDPIKCRLCHRQKKITVFSWHIKQRLVVVCMGMAATAVNFINILNN